MHVVHPCAQVQQVLGAQAESRITPPNGRSRESQLPSCLTLHTKHVLLHATLATVLLGYNAMASLPTACSNKVLGDGFESGCVTFLSDESSQPRISFPAMSTRWTR